jgi:protein gp37
MPKHNTDNGPLKDLNLHNIDRVIVGGESGPKARQMKKEWVLDIKDQCYKAHVRFFFKQWGGFKRKKSGRLLEGNIYNEMPDVNATLAYT